MIKIFKTFMIRQEEEIFNYICFISRLQRNLLLKSIMDPYIENDGRVKDEFTLR